MKEKVPGDSGQALYFAGGRRAQNGSLVTRLRGSLFTWVHQSPIILKQEFVAKKIVY